MLLVTRSALKIQHWWRRLRSPQSKSELACLNHQAATRIQAWWRGQQFRRHLITISNQSKLPTEEDQNQSIAKKLTIVRTNLIQANRVAYLDPSRRLVVRAQIAWDQLNNSKSVSQIMEAVKCLGNFN